MDEVPGGHESDWLFTVTSVRRDSDRVKPRRFEVDGVREGIDRIEDCLLWAHDYEAPRRFKGKDSFENFRIS